MCAGLIIRVGNLCQSAVGLSIFVCLIFKNIILFFAESHSQPMSNWLTRLLVPADCSLT